ncbi:MAG: hypothetical protein ABIP48_03350 [Planctomycetota bacterium]
MCTIVVHGTLARDETWWRVQKPGGFLDALARGMLEGGREPDLWTTGGRHVSCFGQLQPKGKWGFFGTEHPPFDQIRGQFRWPGSNMHIDRVNSGEQLARYLEALASISPGETIDIVAHSHGCNLVKVATNHVSPGVRLGRAVFLACPHCENAGGGSGHHLYRLDVDSLSRDGGPGWPVLNVYSEEDTVQTDVAEGFPDFLAGATGTRFAPVFRAHRTDSDPMARGAYDNLRLPTRMGGGTHVHSAIHSPTVGRVVGYWLACWPTPSGEECLELFGIDVLTDRDTG